MHRNSMVNLIKKPNDYILAQQENVVTADIEISINKS